MVGLGSNPPEDAIYPLAFTDGVRRSYLGRLHVVLMGRRSESSVAVKVTVWPRRVQFRGISAFGGFNGWRG